MAEFWELPIDPRNVFANWFIGNTDPALDPDNRVLKGKPWVQTTNDSEPWGPILGLFFRDADNATWVQLPTGPTGATGATGAAGANGTNGVNGVNGTVIRQGSGAPSNGLGVDGDYYINTANGDLYQKVGGTYGVIENITGPSGPEVCCGRLTLESGVAVSTSDQTGKTTIYWTPYKGARIALYDGASWSVIPFAETSLALGTLVSGKNYDVFGYNNSGTLTLELSAAWTNNTTRADAIVLQDGVLCKTGALTRRYLGTIRTTSTTTTEDSGGGGTTQVGGKRFVWNYFNRIRRALKVIDTTASWSYSTNTWRQANGASGNKIEYVCGVNEEMMQATLLAFYAGNTNSAREGLVSVGFDSVTSPSTFMAGGYNPVAAGIAWNVIAPYADMAGVGYHYLSWMEKGADGVTSNFLGSSGGAQSGLVAWING